LAAQWLDRQLTNDISSTEFRAPETIIDHPWDEKVDIWAVGCLVRIRNFFYVHVVVSCRVCACQTFQLLTGKSLFNPKDDPQGRFSADDEQLLHMMQMTGQTFNAGMLNASAKAGEFFESNGKDQVTCITPHNNIY